MGCSCPVLVVWATAFDLATRLVRKLNDLHAALMQEVLTGLGPVFQ